MGGWSGVWGWGGGRERGEFKRGKQRETVDSANSNSLQESRVRQNSEIVLNVRFNRNPSSPPLPAALRGSAEISRRPPFKYRRETFSALSRISRSMSDACRERREREREGGREQVMTAIRKKYITRLPT